MTAAGGLWCLLPGGVLFSHRATKTSSECAVQNTVRATERQRWLADGLDRRDSAVSRSWAALCPGTSMRNRPADRAPASTQRMGCGVCCHGVFFLTERLCCLSTRERGVRGLRLKIFEQSHGLCDEFSGAGNDGDVAGFVWLASSLKAGRPMGVQSNTWPGPFTRRAMFWHPGSAMPVPGAFSVPPWLREIPAFASGSELIRGTAISAPRVRRVTAGESISRTLSHGATKTRRDGQTVS